MPTGALIGALRITLGLDTAAFEAGAGKAERQVRAMQKEITKTGQSFTKAGMVMTAGITAPFAALIATAIPAAVESQQAMAQVNASLASMGPVAGRSAEQLQKFAGVLQDTSNFDDDDILKSVTANLLTFGKISGEVFDQAQQVIVDYSAKTGKDLQSATIMIGKALQDPVKGITALTKAGVDLGPTQKAMIANMVKTGDIAGAQRIVLAELNKEFVKSAQAQRDATPTAAMAQAWRTLQETVGAIALRVLPPFTKALTGMLDAFNKLPDGAQSVAIGIVAIGAAVGPVLIGIGALIKGFASILPLALKLGPAIRAIGTAFTFVRALAMSALLPALLPILPVLAAVAGGAALVYAGWKHWDDIKAVFARVTAFAGTLLKGFVDLHVNALKGVIALATGVKTWLQDKLGAVFTWLHDKLGWIADKFKWLDDVVVRHSYIPDMVDSIGEHIARLDALMVKPIGAATGAAAESFRRMQEAVAPILARLFPEAVTANKFREELALLEADMRKLGFTAEQTAEAIDRLYAERRGETPGEAKAPVTIVEPDVVSVFGPGGIAGMFPEWEKAANDNAEVQKRTTGEIVEAYARMAETATTAIRSVVDAFKHGDFLDIIGSIADAVGSIYGAGQSAGLFGGARASGGPVSSGKTYLVGERGPELFMPNTSGSIVPNSALRGGAGAAGGARPLYIDLRGALMTEDVLREMQEIANDTTQDGIDKFARYQARAMRQSF